MKTKQWNELKNLTLQELTLQLDQKQLKLFRIKVQHKSAPLKNPLEIRELRKDIARLNTLYKQKFTKIV
ncbi:MAG: 50S ribosomal protein L29 [Elusimicrobia bacterium RIFOXYB2_FULL_48_7]|nr:MAG: 50S ribosomal protein L29 [Elusimicrobia bacterium RIFOXYB2_FULL_48_7]